jgi:hypothetical protein
MHLTRQGMVLGTPATMAPEQLDNPEGVDFRADIYGLGCVLFHALTGQAAYQGTTVQQIITSKITGPVPKATAVHQHLSPAVDGLLARLMAKDRQARPATWAEVGTAIAATPLTVAKPSALRRWAGLTIILALGLSCGSVAAILGHGENRTERPLPPDLGHPLLPSAAPVAAPVPTSQPAAPSVPASLASAPANWVWGAEQPAWPFDTARRLEGWTLTPGARWAAAEDVDNGLAGIAGMIERPLPGLPCRLTGALRLSIAAHRLTDRLMIGVRSADGVATGLAVYNLGAIFHLQLVRIDAVSHVPVVVIGPQVLKPVESLTISAIVTERQMVVSVAGTPVGTVDLLVPPTHLVAVADPNGAPGVIADLAFSLTTP